MPELPEVETTRRGIALYITGETICDVIVRNRQLRWPVPKGLKPALSGQPVLTVDRRAKYLLLYIGNGCLILHLGMSGSLRIVAAGTKPEKHDHVDIVFTSGKCLRFHDPRKFGSLHWTTGDPLRHKLLAGLGPEPLGNTFSGAYLHHRSGSRKQAIKTFIMDSRIVVGVGNIYASEVLFEAGIHPKRAAGNISLQRYVRLCKSIKNVLARAIAKGGTSLRDFTSGEGVPGYFGLELNVYDRGGLTCNHCNNTIRQIRQGQRSTYYCPSCQK